MNLTRPIVAPRVRFVQPLRRELRSRNTSSSRPARSATSARSTRSCRRRRARFATALLVFTVEALPDADATPDRLLVTGRYAHASDHLRAVSDAAGLRRHRIVAEVLRAEGELPVHGWLVSASAG